MNAVLPIKDETPAFPEVDRRRPENHDLWEQRMDAGANRMGRIESTIEELRTTMLETHLRFEAKLDDNSRTTSEAASAAKDTAETVVEIKDILMLGKSFIRIMGYVGTVIKWGGGIAATVISVYMAWRYGKPGP